jgi:membrane protein DedA with SNARE-associated domain
MSTLALMDELQFINDLLSSYGPIATLLLLILPLGEELILISAGILVGGGQMPFLPTAICAYLGVLISDCMWYFASYHYGTRLLHKRWFKRIAHPRRLLEAKHQIERRGAWVIVTARFVPGSRTPAMIMAGSLHMPFWKFILAEGLLVLLTVPLQIGAGMLIARGIGTESTFKTIMVVVGAVVAGVVLTAVLSWWYAFRSSSERAPRAKAKWLRRFKVPRLRHAPKTDGVSKGTVAAPRRHVTPTD